VAALHGGPGGAGAPPTESLAPPVAPPVFIYDILCVNLSRCPIPQNYQDSAVKRTVSALGSEVSVTKEVVKLPEVAVIDVREAVMCGSQDLASASVRGFRPQIRVRDRVRRQLLCRIRCQSASP